MFDSVSKFQIEQYPADFATWLLGEPIALTRLEPTELSVEPIRADSIILLQSPELIFHCEFQTDPDPKIPFREADYRLRGYRKFPEKRMVQVVIYLRETSSELVYQTTFQAGRLSHEFEVIRIWEVPASVLLGATGLLPYAVLGQTEDRAGVLQQVSMLIDELPRIEQSNLIAVTSVLAGLRLDKTVIQRLMRSEIMKESVIYQEILAKGEQKGRTEGRTEGRVEGLVEGRTEEARSMVTRQLTKRFGNIPVELQARINALPIDRVESLGEALLDFTGMADLEAWLAASEQI